MLIEVTETHPPQPGKKMAHVLAADGSKFELWPYKLSQIQVGQRCEVETREREFSGPTPGTPAYVKCRKHRENPRVRWPVAMSRQVNGTLLVNAKSSLRWNVMATIRYS
jgi:hypothetical protein